MSKADLTSEIAERTGLTKANVSKALDAISDCAAAAVAYGRDITIPGIGKIGTRQTAARVGRNPATGASVEIPAKRAVTFKVAKALKDAANG